jgi:3-oxoacyl-[acyl-carrier-protein] synthase II
MARDIQLAIGSAHLAVEDSGLDLEGIDRTRFGVNYGAGLIATELSEISPAVKVSSNGSKRVDLKEWGREGLGRLFPLWMLKYLPNMPACHISIIYDAQGPNNSLTVGEASATLAIGEAVRVIQRGSADIFLAGGTDSKIHPLSLVRLALLNRLTRRNEPPESAMRPFDRGRDGIVPGEGSAAIVIEELAHAKKRGARVNAEILGFGAYCDPRSPSSSLAKTIELALRDANLSPADLGHISAVGASGQVEDRDEAVGIAKVLASSAGKVPVVAYKSAVGPLAAASGAVELIASVIALREGTLPGTLNFESADADAPTLAITSRVVDCPEKPFLTLARSYSGQCAALVVGPVRES